MLYNYSAVAKIQRQMHVTASIIFCFVSKVIACKSSFSQGTINIWRLDRWKRGWGFSQINFFFFFCRRVPHYSDGQITIFSHRQNLRKLPTLAITYTCSMYSINSYHIWSVNELWFYGFIKNLHTLYYYSLIQLVNLQV